MTLAEGESQEMKEQGAITLNVSSLGLMRFPYLKRKLEDSIPDFPLPFVSWKDLDK